MRFRRHHRVAIFTYRSDKYHQLVHVEFDPQITPPPRNNTMATITSSSLDRLTVCALQPRLRGDSESPQQAIDHVIDLMCRAADPARTTNGVDLLVLPELCPVGYSEHTFAHYLPTTPENQQLYHDLDAQMAETARRLSVHICYGTIGWHPRRDDAETTLQGVDVGHGTRDQNIPSPSKYDLTIRQIVVGPTTGERIAVYDKMYLCDVGDCSESRFFVPSPSRQLTSFTIGRFRCGLMICFDQRFPSLAQSYAGGKHNVDVLLHPAAFVRDVTFATWKSFRETRAIETSCYFIGLNYSGTTHGETTVVPPWVDDSGNPDTTAVSLGCDESWLVCDIQRSVLDHVRSTFPFYRILKGEAVQKKSQGC